jgi:hypothetical protein
VSEADRDLLAAVAKESVWGDMQRHERYIRMLHQTDVEDWGWEDRVELLHLLCDLAAQSSLVRDDLEQDMDALNDAAGGGAGGQVVIDGRTGRPKKKLGKKEEKEMKKEQARRQKERAERQLLSSSGGGDGEARGKPRQLTNIGLDRFRNEYWLFPAHADPDLEFKAGGSSSSGSSGSQEAKRQKIQQQQGQQQQDHHQQQGASKRVCHLMVRFRDGGWYSMDDPAQLSKLRSYLNPDGMREALLLEKLVDLFGETEEEIAAREAAAAHAAKLAEEEASAKAAGS